MSAPVSVIMPAFRAEATIAASVASVLGQSVGDFELVIAADDWADYAGVLAAAGIADPRIVFTGTGGTGTGGTGTGSANARNTALRAARHKFVATLDADDRFAPQKLETGAAVLLVHPLVTTGLSIETSAGRPLRQVGCTGTTALLGGADYKRVNLSMDSMVMWDRERVPVSYDATLPCLVDLELMLQAFGHVDAALHIGAPLHVYVKQPASMSNAPGSSPVYALTKQALITRIKAGQYSFNYVKARNAFLKFLKLSLKAEQDYETALDSTPGLIFEDILEPLLAEPGA
ncbi:MAG TPA: glycosyltransferase family 2 protein [Devosiaceae bacterium]|nr:glycosyltransferase family 2 protein [Devosiaceae bacterium]